MVIDGFGRPLSTLRLSVTDRCNLRCSYCMPEATYQWLEKPHLLSFEELARVVRILRAYGLDRVRITGGEPLLRQDLPKLVAMLAAVGVSDLSMTSNAVLLARSASDLLLAGLKRLTVSLDTLKPDVFVKLAQRDELAAVRLSLDLVAGLGFHELKLDTVLVRGINHDEAVDLVRFAGDLGAEIRFIEYMDVGGATGWRPDLVVSQAELLQILAGAFGEAVALPGRGAAPAQRFRLGNGQTIGIVASVTQPFCADCDRLRMTADGQLLACLYAKTGLDVRTSLRRGDSDDQIGHQIGDFWRSRVDQGALQRAGMLERSGYVSLEELRTNPRLEMHTRGG
ncbi:GTP 3',8-cyclase MoaA [bacterium]|nr:GTP 3',8-cyclase MoaA [bacterium]